MHSAPRPVEHSRSRRSIAALDELRVNKFFQEIFLMMAHDRLTNKRKRDFSAIFTEFGNTMSGNSIPNSNVLNVPALKYHENLLPVRGRDASWPCHTRPVAGVAPCDAGSGQPHTWA